MARQSVEVHPAPGRRADAIRNEAAIIDAAMRVLADRPAASMGEIAEASGLGRATLYRHFRTRGELLAAIQQHALAAAGQAIAACRLATHPARTALVHAVEALIGVGDRYRVLGREITLSTRMFEQQHGVARPLLATIRRGQRTGDLRRDLPAPWVLASMGNLLVLALREIGAGRLEPAAATRLVTTTLLDGIARDGAGAGAHPPVVPDKVRATIRRPSSRKPRER
ncbi:MAG: TetR/AcrR family transcriptional regulator [Jatrophihabitans sp.]|nr:MAG: TetR/AcrR family transcriptional regulator [Jatrophihabitans sp.]